MFSWIKSFVSSRQARIEIKGTLIAYPLGSVPSVQYVLKLWYFKKLFFFVCEKQGKESVLAIASLFAAKTVSHCNNNYFNSTHILLLLLALYIHSIMHAKLVIDPNESINKNEHYIVVSELEDDQDQLKWLLDESRQFSSVTTVGSVEKTTAVAYCWRGNFFFVTFNSAPKPERIRFW